MVEKGLHILHKIMNDCEVEHTKKGHISGAFARRQGSEINKMHKNRNKLLHYLCISDTIWSWKRPS